MTNELCQLEQLEIATREAANALQEIYLAVHTVASLTGRKWTPGREGICRGRIGRLSAWEVWQFEQCSKVGINLGSLSLDAIDAIEKEINAWRTAGDDE